MFPHSASHLPTATPRFTCWSPNPQCDRFWRWDLWEGIRFRWVLGEVLRAGLLISALRRTDLRICFLLAVWGLSEKVAVCVLGRRSHQKLTMLHLDFGLLVSMLWENNFLSFKPQQCMIFCYGSLSHLKYSLCLNFLICKLRIINAYNKGLCWCLNDSSL